MSEELLASSIAAPGFMGVNTQDSSVGLESGYATTAFNCVIDKFGRIGARKGWLAKHASNADLSTADVKAIGELIDNAGNSYIVFTGNNKLFKLVGSTVTELTYGGGGTAPTISDSNWQMATLSGCLYLYQSGHTPLVFDPATSATTYKRISEKTGYLGTVQSSNCVISAYGRTWSANTATDKNTIQFSDLQAGHVLSTGTSGTLDVSRVWPNGADEIIALAAHNNQLFIFGRRQILIYQGAADPSAMSLYDTITGVGCCARDSVAKTGTDVFFLSDSGVRSIARTIQEKSAPMTDLSSNVRDDLVADLNLETLANIKAVFSDNNAFYLITFPTSNTTYCFDTRTKLPNGASRVTTWDLVPKAMFVNRNKEVLMGFAGYLGYYTGQLDRTASYRLQYMSNFIDFAQPMKVKILKKIGFTLIGGNQAPVAVKYAFDYSLSYQSRNIVMGNSSISEWGTAEFGEDEWTAGIVFDNQRIQAGGSGNVIQFGIETVIDNFELSIQKMDVFVKMGRTL
jgi:hypothetical protein